MTQLRNRYIEEPKDENLGEIKTLPNAFCDTEDELSAQKSFFLSAILHPIVVGLAFMVGLVFQEFNLFYKPQLKPRNDIVYVITQNEAPPINKNTKFRSDRNSRAGGKHDPKRAVSMPTPAAKPTKQAASAPNVAPKKQEPKKSLLPKVTPQKTVQKTAQAPKAPAKPQPVKAPSPSLKPNISKNTTIPKTQAPKLATAPKSPFSVAVPKSTAPVGPRPTYGTGSGTKASGGSTSTSKGVGMPTPQFSASKGSGSGSGSTSRGSTGSAGSRGSGYSGGNVGNPGPGNPSGPPGIDAIKQPNWGPYMRDLESRIKRNWNPPKGDQSKRVVLLFKIGRDGRLLSITTVRSSGQPLADQAAKSAVQLTAPFRPLPPEFRGNSIDIEFTFDYNVLGASYR